MTDDQKKDLLVSEAIVDDKAQEELVNKIALLNVARATMHRPRAFVDISQWQQSVPTSSVQATKSFNTAPGSTLELQGQSDTSQVTLSPLDKQEFVRGTTTAISPDILAYYIQQGYPPSMLLHLFVREIRVFNASGDLDKTYANTPLMAGADSYAKFDEIINGLSACYIHTDTVNELLNPGDASVPSIGMPKDPDLGDLTDLIGKGYAMLPDVTQKDQYFLVQQKSRFIFDKPADRQRKIWCDGAYALMGVDTPYSDDDEKAGASPDDERKKQVADAAKLLDPESPPATETSKRQEIAEWIRPFALTRKNPHFEIVLRSPEAVIYYLGEVSREQTYGPYKDSPEVSLDEKQRTYIGVLDLRPCYTARDSASDSVCQPRCIPIFTMLSAAQPSPDEIAQQREMGRRAILHPLPDITDLPQQLSCYFPGVIEEGSTDKTPAVVDLCKVPVTTSDITAINEKLLSSANLQIDYEDRSFAMPWDIEEHTETMTAFSIMQQILGLQTNATELPTTGLVKAGP